jgi:ABC-2 type transport system permease protein
MSTTVTPSKTDPQIPAIQTSSALSDFLQETGALTRRLFIQLQRRPSTLIAGIVQPIMWLVLFGALFQNAPQGFVWHRC